MGTTTTNKHFEIQTLPTKWLIHDRWNKGAVTGLHGGSERCHVVVKSVSHVDQTEAESSRFQILSSCNASESSTHHHHMDPLHLRHLAPHLCGHLNDIIIIKYSSKYLYKCTVMLLK